MEFRGNPLTHDKAASQQSTRHMILLALVTGVCGTEQGFRLSLVPHQAYNDPFRGDE